MTTSEKNAIAAWMLTAIVQTNVGLRLISGQLSCLSRGRRRVKRNAVALRIDHYCTKPVLADLLPRPQNFSAVRAGCFYRFIQTPFD